MKKRNLVFLTAIFPVLLFAQWQKIPTNFRPHSIAVPDSNTIWSVNFVTNKRLTKSTDGGQSWTDISVPNLNQESMLSGTINAADADNAWIYFQLHPSYSQFLYRTTDGGSTWTQLTLPGGASVFFVKFYDTAKGLVMAQDFAGHVFIRQTTDGGQSWTPYTISIEGAPLGVTTLGDRFVWLYTGSGVLWHSTDNGANWTQYNTGIIATNYGLAMAFRDSLNGIAAVDHYTDQILKTSDGGATWAPISTLPHLPPVEKTYVWGISAVPGEPQGWIIGDNEGTVFTLDGGNTWTGEANFPDLDFRAPVFADNLTAWSFTSTAKAIFKWQLPLDSTGTSGIATPQFSAQLKVLPNPSNGNVSILLSHLPAGPTVVTLRDLPGKTIRQFNPTITGEQLLLDNIYLLPGIYLVEVWDGKQQLALEKIVVMGE